MQRDMKIVQMDMEIVQWVIRIIVHRGLMRDLLLLAVCESGAC